MSPGGHPGPALEIERFKKQYQSFHQRLSQSQVDQGWCTPNRILFRQGPVEVREFTQVTDAKALPVLIVYSHVNRPAVVDLEADHSLVRRLIETGNRVYLMDWLPVQEADRNNDLSVYVMDAIGDALDCVFRETGSGRINLVGICQGGTFALCHACLRPQRVRKLALMVTPVDFHAGDSLIRHWSRHIDFDRLVANPINIPGGLITLMFRWVRPFNDLQRHIRQIDQLGADAEFDFALRVDQWAHDCPDQPGRAFAQFMGALYGQNRLVEGTFGMQGEVVDLSSLRRPVLNIFAGRDHLVPPASSAALSAHVAPEWYSELQYCGGHIGLIVSARAQQAVHRKLGHWLASAV